MDKKAVETLAVNAVRDNIVVSKYLDQFIADNDKEPSWDGNIYIYNGSSKKKSDLRGRLPVQVKGTENSDHSNDQISFSVSTVDLKNYLNDGGVMYFVVYIGHDGFSRQIYYAELPPIKIRFILTSAKEQKTKAIKLKKLPTDPNEKARIIINCWESCQKQSSFTNAELLSIEALEEQGVLEGLTIPFTTIGDTDPKEALLKSEVYMYAKIKGSSVLHPLDLLPDKMVIEESKKALITIGDKLYYDQVKIFKSSSFTNVVIGESLTIEFDTSPIHIKYKNSNSLRTLVKDLDFMIAYIENGSFCYDGITFYFDNEGANYSNFNIDDEKETLSFAKQVVQVLDILNCKKDIDINALKSNDIRNLEILIKAFLEKVPVPNLKDDIPSIACMRIGELQFVFYVQPIENEKGTKRVEDFFLADIDIAYENQEGVVRPISQFSILHAEDLIRLDNIRYNVLLPSFQCLEHHNETFARATLFLLELIKAYDLCGNKEFLHTADEFADWILTAREEEVPYYIKLLNKLQIIKRDREFTDEEKKELYAIVENMDSPDVALVGSYLLLDQQIPAEMHFEKLSDKQKKEFVEYPIYNFWKSAN